MADLPYTLCFRVGPDLKQWLGGLAIKNHRKRSDVIRILLEQIKQKYEEESSEQVQLGDHQA